MTRSRAVSNSGPLIHLARANALNILKGLYSKVLIPREVEFEVVLRGKEKGYPDAFLVEEAIQEGWIKVIEVNVPHRYLSLALRAGLHEAEAKVVWLAREERLTALLDDNAARDFARLLGVKVRGSIGIVLEATKKKGYLREKKLYAYSMSCVTSCT